MPKDDAIHEAEMLEISLGLVGVQATAFFGGWKLRGKPPKSPCEFGQVTFQAHDLAHFLLLGASAAAQLGSVFAGMSAEKWKPTG